MIARGFIRGSLAAAVAMLVALGSLAVAAERTSKMSSTKLSSKLCETNGGGKFVDIPGFPGEMIDRRLLRDVKWLQRKYKIFVTDGYSTSDVHSWNGEHPIGLALDIVPDKAAGGRWSDISRLARWAEPRQDRPREPFRWVGYNGDSGHGRGHHLHLSWNHSMTKPKKPAETVYSVRCPGSGGGKDGGSGGGDNGGSGGGGGGGEPKPDGPPSGGSSGGGFGAPSGGVGGKRLGPPVVEAGGVDG